MSSKEIRKLVHLLPLTRKRLVPVEIAEIFDWKIYACKKERLTTQFSAAFLEARMSFPLSDLFLNARRISCGICYLS